MERPYEIHRSVHDYLASPPLSRLFWRKLIRTAEGEPVKLDASERRDARPMIDSGVLVEAKSGHFALNPDYVRLGAPEPTLAEAHMLARLSGSQQSELNTEVPTELYDRLRARAEANGSTIKDELTLLLVAAFA